jgi:hypothetical protein
MRSGEPSQGHEGEVRHRVGRPTLRSGHRAGQHRGARASVASIDNVPLALAKNAPVVADNSNDSDLLRDEIEADGFEAVHSAPPQPSPGISQRLPHSESLPSRARERLTAVLAASGRSLLIALLS